MKPEYVDALELQLAWNAFHQRHADEVWTAAEQSAQYKVKQLPSPAAVRIGREHAGHIMGEGDVFYLAKNIGRMAEVAAESLPPMNFDITMLPSRAGFMVLESPMELSRTLLSEVVGEVLESKHLELPPMYARVIGWRSAQNAMPDPYAHNLQPGAAEFMFLTDGDIHGARGYWPLTYFGIQSGETWGQKMEQYQHNVLTPAGEQLVSSKPSEIKFIFALMLLMQQRILAARAETTDRAQRRRSEKAGRPDHHCKVITLRRYAERAPTEAEERDVDWAWQWMVRGHWRNQPYGPGQGLRRPIWIEPFTKGPPGAPFRDDDARRLFAVAR